jgi:hypothetical protein
MAPLPFNNTGVYSVEYRWSNGTASMQVRVDEATASYMDAVSALGGFIDTLGGWLDVEWAYTGATYTAEGANFSIPVVTPNQPITSNDLQNEAYRPLEMSFTGRSTGGRRVSISVFGSKISQGANYRYVQGELPDIDDALLYLSTVATTHPGTFVAVDGLLVNWKLYVNLNFNSYWERQARV